jgi:transposase
MPASDRNTAVPSGNKPLSDSLHSPVSGSQPARAADAKPVDGRICPETTARKKKNSCHGRREELAILHLLTSHSIEEAAERSRCSERTLRRWLQQPAFAAEFKKAKRILLDQAMDRLLRNADRCADTLVQLATNRKVTASARVRACVKVIELAVKTNAIAQVEERLSQVEAALQKRKVM